MKGTHVVCAVVTEEFLAYTKARGNDLSTPHPEFQVKIKDKQYTENTDTSAGKKALVPYPEMADTFELYSDALGEN